MGILNWKLESLKLAPPEKQTNKRTKKERKKQTLPLHTQEQHNFAHITHLHTRQENKYGYVWKQRLRITYVPGVIYNYDITLLWIKTSVLASHT